MKMMFARWAGAMALALMIAPGCVMAQDRVFRPGSDVPQQGIAFGEVGSTATSVSTTNPLPVAATPSQAAATSTAQTGTVTSSTATASSGTVSISGGVATIGPMTPQLGRDIRVVLHGTWAGTFALGTSVNGCATINPLTIGGYSWGSYTANANEAVDTPSISGVVYCATATVTSGTLNYAVRQ